MTDISDILIVGCGIAGGPAAIRAARAGKNVTLVTKTQLDDTNTTHAQGGIAAVEEKNVLAGLDSYESHIDDTLKSGAGLCKPEVVDRVIRQGYEFVIQFMEELGVSFSNHLHQEGGHDHKRVYNTGDSTGRKMQDALVAAIRDEPNITVLEDHVAVNLITLNKLVGTDAPFDKCLGAYVLDKDTGKVMILEAKNTILATGGTGRAFQYTSNPSNATGDGIAMAYRAGAKIANMEFFQFHPTVLYEQNPDDPSEQRFLLTEALRGEEMGAILTLLKDSTDDFVRKYDGRGSHATRDIVAHAIDTEIKKGIINEKGVPQKHVWLNATAALTGKSEDFIRSNYEQIYEHCIKKGIDIAIDPIPVIPAAHYTCGGVIIDENGLTDIQSLYAIGEVSCSGLMGANRLASNSLLEGAYYAKIAIDHIIANEHLVVDYRVPIIPWKTGSVETEMDVATMNQYWDTIRTTMTNLCGIDRNKQRLEGALHILEGIVEYAEKTYEERYPTNEILELRNLSLMAQLIAQSALARGETRGGHFRGDFPEQNDDLYRKYTVAQKDSGILL